jgi:hypothetical protein
MLTGGPRVAALAGLARKLKFEPITGISSDDQVLSLLRTDGGEFICQLSEDQRSLASYGVAGKRAFDQRRSV